MIDITKLRADALAAKKADWPTADEMYSGLTRKDAVHIANCDPATLIKLLDVVEAARILVNDAQAHPGVISVAQLAEAIQLLETK
jgi:hypothetical protein